MFNLITSIPQFSPTLYHNSQSVWKRPYPEDSLMEALHVTITSVKPVYNGLPVLGQSLHTSRVEVDAVSEELAVGLWEEGQEIPLRNRNNSDYMLRSTAGRRKVQ